MPIANMTRMAIARAAVLAPAAVTVYLKDYEPLIRDSGVHFSCKVAYTVFLDNSFVMNAVDCERFRRRAMD